MIAWIFTNSVIKNVSLSIFVVFVFQHTLLVADPRNLIDAEMIVGSRKPNPMLYEGVGMIADPENPLVLNVLHASSTAYSFDPDSEISEVGILEIFNPNLFDIGQFETFSNSSCNSHHRLAFANILCLVCNLYSEKTKLRIWTLRSCLQHVCYSWPLDR